MPGRTGEDDKVHEDDLPFDDPVARTRMAWLRTTLIVALIGLLHGENTGKMLVKLA